MGFANSIKPFLLLAALILFAPPQAAFASSLTVESIPQSDVLSTWFNKRVMVFGVEVVGSSSVTDAKILHAASVMAEYLDGNEDGVADQPAVVAAMVDRKATLVMFGNVDQLESSGIFDTNALDDRFMQDCLGNETNPANGFDASLEEVLHLVHTAGFAPVYPALRTVRGSALSNAMDTARGGYFNGTPNQYPASSWYHYDDETCEYDCHAAEYFYWGLTSWLGAQAGRCDDISHEWEPCTAALLTSTDPTLQALLTDPAYGLPTRIPDGNYVIGSQGICGNGNVEAAEQCDDGNLNGTGSSCCTKLCAFKPDGAASCDGNACTRTDTCNAGVCSAGPCAAGAPCSVCGGTCIAQAGACECQY